MKLDINEIYHQYIVKIVIFSLFLYKGQIKHPNAYKLSVMSFLIKRIPWKIDLIIDTGIKLDKEDSRDLALEQILNGVESDYMTTVIVTFTTPLKTITMNIDLKDEDKYEHFIYS